MTITYLVSGPMKDLQIDEIDLCKKKISEAFYNNANFVCGTAPGIDELTIRLISELIEKSDSKAYDRLTLYCKGSKSEIDLEKIPGASKFKLITGFTGYSARDYVLSFVSDDDIAIMRSIDVSKKIYGEKFDPGRKTSTQKNLERRKLVETIKKTYKYEITPDGVILSTLGMYHDNMIIP